MVAESAADVRASLRRLGLQVIELRALRAPRRPSGDQLRWIEAARETTWKYLRARRRGLKAELFDSLATLLESGLPLLESIETMQVSSTAGSRGRRSLVVDLQSEIRSGAGMSQAMSRHPSWFDAIEIAIVAAGEQAGELARVLRQVSARHQRSDSLQQRLATALLYPFVIAIAGLIVVVFLSVKTLPELSAILIAADVEPPRLTRVVESAGRLLAHGWVGLGGAALATLVLGPLVGSLISRSAWIGPIVARWRDRCTPSILRRTSIAALALSLAELTEAGIPLVEALRLTRPASHHAGLRARIAEAINALERGESLGAAFADDRWFDAEFRRLLDIGQSSGRLGELLSRLAERYRRRSERAIDRFAALLEPAAIIALAILIGIVVLAAVQPLVRLQEVV